MSQPLDYGPGPRPEDPDPLDGDDHPVGEPRTALCIHPWHFNPGLIVPCPQCGEGYEQDREEGEVPW